MNYIYQLIFTNKGQHEDCTNNIQCTLYALVGGCIAIYTPNAQHSENPFANLIKSKCGTVP